MKSSELGVSGDSSTLTGGVTSNLPAYLVPELVLSVRQGPAYGAPVTAMRQDLLSPRLHVRAETEAHAPHVF